MGAYAIVIVFILYIFSCAIGAKQTLAYLGTTVGLSIAGYVTFIVLVCSPIVGQGDHILQILIFTILAYIAIYLNVLLALHKHFKTNP
jgi:predicted branched-subunit amino acid permease